MEERRILVIARDHAHYQAWLKEQRLDGVKFKYQPRYVGGREALYGINGAKYVVLVIGTPHPSSELGRMMTTLELSGIYRRLEASGVEIRQAHWR